MRSSITMQSYTQTLSGGLQMRTPQQTSCSRMQSSTPQTQYYIHQQRISQNQNHQQYQGSFSGQPSQLQSSPMPQARSSKFQNQMLFTNSASVRSAFPAAQHGNGNTVPQQNYNMLKFNANSLAPLFPSLYNNASSASGEKNLTHQAALPQHQSLNGHQKMQTDNQTLQEVPIGQIREGNGNGGFYSFVNHLSAKTQRLTTPNYSCPTGTSRSNYNGTQVQYSSQIQNNPAYYSHFNLNGKNHGSLRSNLPHPQSYTSQHAIIKTPPNQTMNQITALSLHQDSVQTQQSNTLPVSGHQSHFAVPANQGNTHTKQQCLQFNKGNTALPMSSQVTMSSSIPTSNSYFQARLIDLLTEKENPQVHPQRHESPVSCLEARSATQGQTHNYYQSHITTKAISTQSTVSGSYSNIPAKSKESRSSKNQFKPDVQSAEGLWQESNSETTLQRNNGPKSSDGLGEAQHTTNVAKHQELFAAWQKVVLQSHKAVAVVPPISQQVPSPDMNIESIPFKTDQVSGKNVESNASSLPKHKNESTVDTIIPEIQSTGVAQSNISSQNSVCSTASTSKSPEDHSEVNAPKSNGDLFHLSKVQVSTFTQNSFLCLLKHFESTRGTLKNPVADFEKCLLDLYWGGGKRNLLKRAQTFPAEYTNLLSALSTKEIETAVFQYLKHKDLMRLAPRYHVLKDDTILPTDEFRSSWLNLDGQPADIEKMLAEPVMDFNLPSYAVQEGLNTLNLNSEPSTTTDCQNDDKEISNVMVCESKSTDKITKKQGDKSLGDHQVQSRSLEQSFQSDEIADPLDESIREAECEQVCRDAGEKTVSSFEMVEQGDLSIDFDFSKDSQTFQHLLLSSDADDTSLKGCNLKKESSHLCQVEIPEVSANPDNSANAFSSSVNRIKFTCPHVTGNDLDSEPFCSRCWEETPLLDLDLEEALFSPEPRTTEVESLEGIVSEPGDATESCSSLGDESAVKQTLKCTESVHLTMPIEEQVCETNSSVAPELPEAPSPAQNIKTPVVPEQPQTQSGDISPLCNKSKPTKTAGDAFFITDIEAVKTSSPKPHPNGQNSEDEPAEKGELRKSSIKWKTQMNAPSSQSDKQDPNGNEWSSSNYSSTSTCEANIRKPDCSPDASVPTCSSVFHKSPDKQAFGQERSESVSSPIEANMTKSSSGKVSPPKYPHKIVKVFKTVSVPTLDGLFTPDIVVKKASAPKPHSDDLSVSSTKDDQGCKDKRVKRGENKSLITLEKQGSGQTNEDTCQKQTPAKFQVLYSTPRKNAGPNQDKTGQNKATKKLALYGLHNSNGKRREVHHHQCFNRVTLSTAPAYITLSNSPKSTKSYTDTPSAKQKVYDEWSSKFFPDTKKKRQKSEKVELKSRIQALKRNLVEKQFIDMLEDFDAGPKAKKIKFKRAIFKELF